MKTLEEFCAQRKKQWLVVCQNSGGYFVLLAASNVRGEAEAYFNLWADKSLCVHLVDNRSPLHLLAGTSE